jgi:hypothetical protein
VGIQERRGGQGGRPWYVKVHVALGDAYTQAGQHREAREAWQHGWKHFPGSQELKIRLSTRTTQDQLEYVESQRSLDKPVETDLAYLDEEK